MIAVVVFDTDLSTGVLLSGLRRNGRMIAAVDGRGTLDGRFLPYARHIHTPP